MTLFIAVLASVLFAYGFWGWISFLFRVPMTLLSSSISSRSFNVTQPESKTLDLDIGFGGLGYIRTSMISHNNQSKLWCREKIYLPSLWPQHLSWHSQAQVAWFDDGFFLANATTLFSLSGVIRFFLSSPSWFGDKAPVALSSNGNKLSDEALKCCKSLL